MLLFIYSRSEVRNFFKNFLPGNFFLFPKDSSVLFFILMVRAMQISVPHYFPLTPEKIKLLFDIYL